MLKLFDFLCKVNFQNPFIIMRLSLVVLVVSLFFLSCGSGSNPDVSDIKIDLTTERFEKNLFDTTTHNLVNYLSLVQSNAPSFTTTFVDTILNADPTWPLDSIAEYVNAFIKAYRPVYERAEKMYADFKPYEKEIEKGLQYVKHYFPDYKVPHKLITYIGPADGYGDILSGDALIVGLQQHLGKDFELYKTELIQQTYPEYVSNRFEPDYIAVNCIKNIVNDIYPEREEDKPLVYQMVEKGKRLYILSKLLPNTDEYKLIGYTREQLKDSYAKEDVVWDMFIKNSYLQVIDKNIIKNYIDESPKTPELGEAAPGNIGSFAGWQIVKKYMQKNAGMSLQQLIKTDNELIFQEAKYKP